MTPIFGRHWHGVVLGVTGFTSVVFLAAIHAIADGETVAAISAVLSASTGAQALASTAAQVVTGKIPVTGLLQPNDTTPETTPAPREPTVS